MKIGRYIAIGIGIAVALGVFSGISYNGEQKIETSEHFMIFSAGNMTFHEELCLANEGWWIDYQYDSKCYFESETKHQLAESVFEEAGKTKITGEVAKKICSILDIPCPEDAKFDAWLDRDEGTAWFSYYKNQERFTFVIEDSDIRYRSDSTQNQWITFDDKILELFGAKPEVVAFYTVYPDAQEEIRDDHVSYFAGSENDYHVRMNMFFDENYNLENIDFHCYHQKVHQFEFPQEDIVTSIDRFVCKDVENPQINSFDDCVRAGNPVMESYPRQCRTEDGLHFVEEISGLDVLVSGENPVRRGTTQSISVQVMRDEAPVSGALVRIDIEDYGEDLVKEHDGFTDSAGVFVLEWEIPETFDDVETLLAIVDVSYGVHSVTEQFSFSVYCLPGEGGCKAEGN